MTTATTSTRPPFWRDVRVLRIVFQAAVVAAVVAFLSWLWNNLQTNADSTGIPLSFDYLDQPSDITVPGNSLRPTQSVLDAILVGFGNTIRIAAAGVVLSTIVGIAVGIARLSTNWLLSTIARVYVEIVRNVPLLVVVITAYRAVFLRLPRVEEASVFAGVFLPTIKGVSVVWFTTDDKGAIISLVVAVALIVAIGVARWRRSVNEATGAPARAGLLGLAAFVAVAIVGHAAIGWPLGISTPELDGRNVAGGINMLPEYAALLFALVIYTSSHIAEIVRGSIQAVPKGQFEAATALALSGAQRMRLVILPQALRIAVPALGNQYLNLTKNSSLAVAISFFELTKVTQVSIANRSPAVPSFALLLVLYLVLSLVLSFVVNLANRRLALVDR